MHYIRNREKHKEFIKEFFENTDILFKAKNRIIPGNNCISLSPSDDTISIVIIDSLFKEEIFNFIKEYQEFYRNTQK